MKLVSLLVMVIFSVSLAQAEGSPVKAFKDWKADKVTQIQNRIGASKAQIEALKAKKIQDNPVIRVSVHSKAEAAADHLIQYYEKQVAQEQWNLEVAEDLSVTDYIVLYLAAQPSKTRFQQAASQLSPVEVAELMEAYSSNLGAQTPSENIASSPSASAASVAPATATQHR